IALAGADLGATLNGEPLPLWQAVAVKTGDEIAFSGVRSGCRAYLAVAGGIDVPLVMGSRSTYLRGKIGGLEGRALKAWDQLAAGEPAAAARARVGRRVPAELIPTYDANITLRVVLGPQDDLFTPAGRETFLTSEYAVTNEADRMGYRLEGPKIEHAGGADIISDGIPLGAVQVPGHGQPIVMLADRQTTGGYTKIATVISADLFRIGQAKPGDKVRFAAVSRQEAIALLREQEEKLQRLAEVLSRPAGPVRHFRIRVQDQVFEATVEEL
ncbi:MAG TPA: biotin-dependent carboxyltransferase, partial [Firmicutes bacterium]|nr:biotin-dependent carboxyltransferase [Bacillota bacterium]